MCARREESAMDSVEGDGVLSVGEEEEEKKLSKWKLWTFLSILVIDLIVSCLLLFPLVPFLSRSTSATNGHYTLYGSLIDLAILSILRIFAGSIAILISYSIGKGKPESPFDAYHKNGDRKTQEELEMEALEESFCPWFKRYISRPAFCCECISLITGVYVVIKCLGRLDVELGPFADQYPHHPIFWICLCFVAIIVVIESTFVDTITVLAGEIGKQRRAVETSPNWIQRIGSGLSLSLLANDSLDQQQQEQQEANGEDIENGSRVTDKDLRGVSDITGDSNYKAGWKDLLKMILPDWKLIAIASVFLVLAAIAQVYIPFYTGKILDSLAHKHTEENDKEYEHSFISNVTKLCLAAILGGIFSAVRGSTFTLVGGRVNVRLRVLLMDSLLSQDIGFFDTTKTGDITSRLTSDTTLVGDQVQLNVNVFLRSLVQAIGVLVFMFFISWQLTLLAFISVPVITILSKWYGNYIRSLTKLMQKKLADGNSISEAALGSMPTVRSFDAAPGELREFQDIMKIYLKLNIRSAVAYLGYCTCITALPQLVIAVVLFYGGLLVRNNDITSGQLVSFLLYLSSLSDAFSSIGYIFSSMTQAVGAADKVFELMHRKPRITSPSTASNNESGKTRGVMGIHLRQTSEYRNRGLRPESCVGEVSLNNVELFYPARPQRRVLHGLTLTAPPGKVVALVGPSGSGKSSVMSLVQHLYEPSAGVVSIDGNKINDLSPHWLSKQVSVVSQEPTLFGRSIRKNIMYGLEGTEDEPTQEEIEEAARLANAASFIEKLPFGYETDVGERGVALSGGQKQRIAIARALVRKPKILLLDEATSALDAESEALVQEAIDDMLARGRTGGAGAEVGSNSSSMTVLIVAHRLSTVRNADIIFVIQEGQVIEQGNHDELISNENGAYTSLISRQMKAHTKLEEGGRQQQQK